MCSLGAPYFSHLISVFFFVVLLHVYYSNVKAEKNINILWLRKKSEEHRPQTKTSRTDNVDEDKFSDTDEREPYMVEKIQVVAIRQHKRVIMKRKKGKENFQEKHLILKISLLFLFFKTY